MSLRICVYGLWNLGSVTAACLAEHFATVGYDPASETIAGLLQAHPPISEPGLAELIAAGGIYAHFAAVQGRREELVHALERIEAAK